MKKFKARVLAAAAVLAALALLAAILQPGAPTAPQAMVAPPLEGPVTWSDPDGPGPLEAGARYEGQIVVDLADGLSPSQVAEIGREHGLDLRYASPWSRASGLTVARVGEDRMATVLADLASDPRVQSAEPDYLYQALDMPAVAAGDFPNDPLYAKQWHMRQIRAQEAWRWSTGRGVVVAIIDTGVAYTDYKNFHRVEDLENTRFVPGYDFVNRSNYPCDDHAHGTHVAGTVAQSTHNGKGVVGVAFDSAIMPLKVLSSRGFGSVAAISDAIHWAADHGAKVINMSLGGPIASTTMEQAVKYAHGKGVVVVCAAGNDGKPRVSYPAAYKESLAVSAVGPDEELTWYSNHGSRVDLAAPGGVTRTRDGRATPEDGVLQNTIAIQNPEKEEYAFFMGTSMASPHVAGAAALVASLGVTRPAAVKALLASTARSKGPDGRARGYGAGILDASRAVWKAGFEYGLGRLVLGVLCGVLAILAFLRRGRLVPALLTLPGILMGSSGLFFLPLVAPQSTPHCPYATSGFPAWDMWILGVSHHANPLFYSCLVPLALSVLASNSRPLRALVAGFAAGVAGHLFFEALSGASAVQLVPAVLSRLWLAANGLICVLLAEVLAEE